jgi:hypothetical protein
VNDDQIEALLRKYRPITRLPDHPITRFPDHPITRSGRSGRTWPWAAAAAALLAVTVGLHGAAWPPAPRPEIDAAQVAAIAEQLGGGAEARAVAEWIVRQQGANERLDAYSPPPFGPLDPQ